MKPTPFLNIESHPAGAPSLGASVVEAHPSTEQTTRAGESGCLSRPATIASRPLTDRPFATIADEARAWPKS